MFSAYDSYFGKEIKGIKPAKLEELQSMLLERALFRKKEEVAKKNKIAGDVKVAIQLHLFY